MTTVWNSADKSANVTLSGSNLIATLTSAAQGGVRADGAGYSTGKKYFEWRRTAAFGNTGSIGWGNATASLSQYPGQNINSFGTAPDNSTAGNIAFNGLSSGFSLGAPITNQWGAVCFDIPNLRAWFKYLGGMWNGSAISSPEAGTAFLNLATLGAGPYFPFFGSAANAAACTINFGATPFQMPIPSGFTAIDAPASGSSVNITKELGYAIIGPPQTLISVSKALSFAITQDTPPVFDRRRRLDYLRK